MSERTSERLTNGGQTNERTSERTREWINERTNQLAIERLDELAKLMVCNGMVLVCARYIGISLGLSWAEVIGNLALGIGHWALGIGWLQALFSLSFHAEYFPLFSHFDYITLLYAYILIFHSQLTKYFKPSLDHTHFSLLFSLLYLRISVNSILYVFPSLSSRLSLGVINIIFRYCRVFIPFYEPL